MRGANIFAILLVVGILLFGCTSPTPPAKPNGAGTVPSSGGEGTAPSETGGTSGSSGTGTSGTGSSGTGSSGTGTSGSGDTGSGSSGSAGDDLAGKGYEALVAMGVPLQCDIATTSQGKTVNMHVYMKGSEDVRSETTIAGAETCAQMVTIMKGNTFYMGCVDGEIMQGCKWLQMDLESSGEPQTAGAAAPPDYSSVPPADISCAPWVYDASKFAVSGKVCNLDDLMKGYGDYPVPDDN